MGVIQQVPGTDALFDEAPCGLIVTDMNGTFLKVNATFCGWVGRERGELLGQKRLQDLLTMGGRIFHQTHWVPTLQMQGSLAEVKFELLHRDGTKIPMILNARRRRRAEGDVDEIAAFVAEDRHRYERELMDARKKADALVDKERAAQHMLRDRALFAEQMVGIVSHDLRNPLSAILMGLQLLGRVDGDRRARVLGHVQKSAQRAQLLIEELLDFTQARVGAGLSATLLQVDLHQVARNALDELRLAYPDRDILHHASGLGPCKADQARLAQLIVNLVSNAVAYGHPGSPIVIRSEVKDQAASVSVQNAGEPIPPELLGAVFEPMVRGLTGTGTVRNVGLGLYIVKEIARAHGGEVSVSSSASEGTRFTLRFPVDAELLLAS